MVGNGVLPHRRNKNKEILLVGYKILPSKRPRGSFGTREYKGYDAI
jgi:hypothetical protein